ncbi:MAG: PKD domain-containing protein [Hyphomicrobiales bacterium]
MKKFLLFTLIAGLGLYICGCNNKEVGDPIAEFTVEADDYTEPAKLLFTNKSAYSNEYKWDFGDGKVSYEKSPYHTFTKAGAYKVTLHASCADKTDTFSRTIEIIANKNPRADFEFSMTAPFTPCKVKFINHSINAKQYKWKFGDPENTTSTEKDPTFTYNDKGTYNIELTVFKDGDQHSITKSIELKGKPVMAKIEKVKILDFTFKKADGSSWDEGSGKEAYPDVYVDITDLKDVPILNGDPNHAIEDFHKAPKTILFTNQNAIIPSLENNYKIRFWDKDPYGKEFIGVLGPINLGNLEGYPNKIELNNEGIHGVVYLNWR